MRRGELRNAGKVHAFLGSVWCSGHCDFAESQCDYAS